jgi:hypothetical protein
MVAKVSSPADELLGGAARSTYRYPPEFAGFDARLRLQSDAGSVETPVSVRVEDGRVTVEGDGSPELEWATDQLRSVVSHRLARPYEEGDGAHGKRLREDGSPLGKLVELDDSMSSSYRVDDGRITLVTRRPEGRPFSIVVQGRTPAPDGSAVPTEFTVFFWDAGGRLEAAEAYTDEYVQAGSLLLPASRLVVRAGDEGILVRRLTLSEHALVGAGR